MKKYREQDTGYNPSSINNFFGLSWGKRESRKQPGAALITLIFILLLFFILSIGILNLVFSRRVTQDKLYYKFCANRLAENGAQIAIYELHKNYYGFNRSMPFFPYKQGDALGKIPKKYLTEDKFTDKEFGFYNIYVDGEIKFTIKADDPDYTKYSLSLSGKNELLDVTYKAENLDFNNCTGDLIITSTANLDNGRYRSVCTVKYKLTNLLDFSLYGSNGIMDGQGYSTTNIDSAKSKIYFNEPMLINGTPTDLQINADKIYINGNIGSDLMNGGDLDNNGFMFYFLQSLWIRSKVSFLNSEGKMIKLPSFMRYNPEAPEDKRVVIPKFENTNTSFNDWKGIDVVDDFEGLVNFVSTRKPNEFNTSSYNEPTVDKNDPQSKLKPYARQIRMDYKDGNNMPLANVNTNATGNIEFNTSNSNDALAFKTFLENNGLYDSKKNEYKIEDASRGVNPKDFQLPTNDTLKNIYSNNANSGDKFLEVDEKSITINGKKYDSSTGVSVKKIFNPSYYNPDGPLQSYVNPIAQWENDNYPKDPGYGYNFKGKDRNCVEIDLSKYTPSGNTIYSEVPLKIINADSLKGNLVIYSSKGIYVEGDFNNKGDIKNAAIVTPTSIFLMPESPKNFKDAGRSLLEYAPKVDEKGNITGFDDNSANYDADKNPYGFLVPDTSPKNPKPDYRKDKDYNYKFLRYAYDENLPTGVKEQNVNSALMSGYLLSLGRGFKPGTSAGTGNSTINIQGTVIKTPYAGESLNVRDLKSDCSTLSKGALQYNGLRTNGPGTAAKGYAYTKHFYEQMPECNLAGYYPYNVGGYIGGICYTYDASLIPNVNFKYMSQLALIPPLVERVSYIIK